MTEHLLPTVVRVGAVDSEDEKFIAKFSKIGSIPEFTSGFFVRQLLDLKDALNFTIEAIPGNEFITDANGTVGGMGLKLIKNEIDLIIASSYMLKYRVQHLSPTHPVSVDKIMIWFRQPKKYTMEDGFIAPFSSEAWFGVLCMLGILLCSAIIISWIEYHCGFRKYLANNYFWILAALCQRGGNRSPTRLPHRLVFLQAFASLWIIYTIYSASVLSRLTVSYNPFTTFATILNANFKILANPLTSTFFEKSLDMHWKSTFIDKMDSVSKIVGGGYAFVTSKDAVGVAARRLKYSDREICDLISAIPFDNLVLPLVFYTRKNYSYKEFINRKLISSMENGLQYRYKKDFVWNTYPICSSVSKITVESIGISEITSAFSIIFWAFVVSLVILIGERLTKSNQWHNRKLNIFG